MLHALVAEEEYVDSARLFQPGSHNGTGRHKPPDVEPLNLERCPDRVEQCLDDVAESACARYLAVLSPSCQDAVEIYRTDMASVQLNLKFTSYTFAHPATVNVTNTISSCGIRYLRNSGIARPAKTIERTFRSHA
jgi:hypothetical protein